MRSRHRYEPVVLTTNDERRGFDEAAAPYDDDILVDA
jgi:hypothetical protein